MNILDSFHASIETLCNNHKVNDLYAFGSVLTENFGAESDVDLIVDFKTQDLLDYADNYFDLKFALEEVLKRPIDLLEEKALKNPYFKRAIYQQRKLIYGQFKN